MNQITSKSFSYSNYESKEDAYAAAQDWKIKTSDELKLTKTWVLKQPDDRVKQYIAGFFDGDGSIGIRNDHTSLMVSFYQSKDNEVPEILTFIQSYYAGYIEKHSRKRGVNQRQAYALTLLDQLAERILPDFSQHSILKKEQVHVALKFITMKKQTALLKERQKCADEIRNSKKNYATVPIITERLTVPYITGFFDAEGCICLSKSGKLDVEFTQTSCPAVLEEMNRVLGSPGVAARGRLHMFGWKAVEVLMKIQDQSIVKRKQIDTILFYVATRDWNRLWYGKHRTEDEKSECEEVSETCKRLKRE